MANSVKGPARRGGRPKGCPPLGGVPKGHVFPGKFPSRVIEVVVRRGEATVSQVLGEVGRFISATRALNLGRRYLYQQSKPRLKKKPLRPESYTQARLIEIGRRLVVGEVLRRAAREGHLVRTAPGVYAAPPPRLYEPVREKTG